MIRKLAGFTPVSSGLDRDEMLFQAGRSSVRRPRFWPRACGLLATTQLATLGLWTFFPHERERVVTVEVQVPSPAPPPSPQPELAPAPSSAESSPPPEPMSYLALTRVFDERGSLPPPGAISGGDQTPHAPLTAGASRTFID